jgi:hypothetical protein
MCANLNAGPAAAAPPLLRIFTRATPFGCERRLGLK